MTQIDEKLSELINAGIDDELSDEQCTELARHLEENPDAQALHRELQQLSAALEPLGDLVPPAQIRENILDVAAPNARSITLRLIAALLPSAMLPRYAMAFAGGLLFGAVALQLGEGYRSDMDPNLFVGSMTDYGTLPHAVTADTVSVDLEQISGSISLHQINSLLVVEFNLASPGAVKLETRFPEQAVDFKGLSLLENDLSSFVADNEKVSLIARGNHHYSIFLENRQQAKTDIKILFLADGEVFHEHILVSPAVE